MQHKCIEPLGESKSDYQIFLELAKRLGFRFVFSEGCTEFDWCKRLFDATDLPKVMSWKQFLKKGYYVVPAPKEELAPRSPSGPSQKTDSKIPLRSRPFPRTIRNRSSGGFRPRSGKIEFVCSSLQRFDPDDPERPVMTKYIPSWEGHHTTELYRKVSAPADHSPPPLQLSTP